MHIMSTEQNSTTTNKMQGNTEVAHDKIWNTEENTIISFQEHKKLMDDIKPKSEKKHYRKDLLSMIKWVLSKLLF